MSRRQFGPRSNGRSAGGKVTEVEKEAKNGKTVYGADMKINGAEWDITVAEDGTVISKEKD
jgi:uncharacterized membrane protein YkoI